MDRETSQSSDPSLPFCPPKILFNTHLCKLSNGWIQGGDLKKCMDRASYVYHKDQFDAAMETLKVEIEEAWKWLSQIPPHTWARHAFDTNCKTYLVANNLSEVFN
jgi:hypothetical protein